MKCEGWRRRGGAFTLGPVKWVQCENKAIVVLEVVQNGKTEDNPACTICWNECIDNNIQIIKVRPLNPANKCIMDAEETT